MIGDSSSPWSVARIVSDVLEGSGDFSGGRNPRVVDSHVLEPTGTTKANCTKGSL